MHGEKKIVGLFKILIGKFETKRLLGKLRQISEENNKMCFKKIVYDID
jgi:hypothetical protein